MLLEHLTNVDVFVGDTLLTTERLFPDLDLLALTLVRRSYQHGLGLPTDQKEAGHANDEHTRKHVERKRAKVDRSKLPDPAIIDDDHIRRIANRGGGAADVGEHHLSK